MAQMLSIGPPLSILQNVSYVLPAQTVLVTSSVPVQISVDGSTWNALTGAETVGAITGATYIRCPTGAATVTCKPAKSVSTGGGGTPSAHAPSHQSGGSDVVDVKQLGGYPGGATFLRADHTFATPSGVVPAAHAATHQTGGSDIIKNLQLAVNGLTFDPGGINQIAPGSTGSYIVLGYYDSTKSGWIRIGGTATGDGGDGGIVFLPGNVPGAAIIIGRGDTTSVIRIDGVTGEVFFALGQLRFPATQNPSADPNTIDDYQEKGWTPSDQSGLGLVFTQNAAANYNKIGSMVFASFNITYPSNANGANSAVSLPVNCNIGGGSVGGGFMTLNTAVAGGVQINIAANGAFRFVNNSGVVLTNANLSGALLSGMLVYRAAQ